MRRSLLVLLLLFAWAPCFGWAAEPARAQVDFNRDIRPILSNHCHKCHGPDAQQRKGGADGLRLDVREAATADLGGYAAIVPGNLEKSELVRRITSTDADERMPPKESGKTLSPREIDLLRKWVEQGATYAQHWSYLKPVRPPLPSVKRSDWPRNEIDYFILSRLEQEQLSPAAEADHAALLRRVSLDLTGLPPSLDDLRTFAVPPSLLPSVSLSGGQDGETERQSDGGKDRYEAYVDKLFNSPAYGEHWARAWLDLARYADSAGYADDPPRTIWPFRDYVIQSLNANQPLDQFTIEQIAGDLFPNPTDEQLTATAFHRNTLTNNEGGTNDEEFRNVAVVDRVNTTLAVWMGTTIACAQCHSHKYDPISQEEYFRLFAFFNNTADADKRDESPLLERYSPEQIEKRTKLEAEIAELEKEKVEGEEDKKKHNEKIAAAKKRLSEIKPYLSVPIQRELLTDKRRVTKLQHRGNYLDVGQEVTAGTPAAFPPLPDGAPADRLALARWLVSPENPLTARVFANRFWEQIFGIGLVATSEEFGSQGELPSHPELLDWLATELVRLNWDQKAFLKLLVMSAAYRQSSRVTPELAARDPDNPLLARGPRVRLSAEMVRDQALAVSGLLSPKMYGPPVKPPQPSIGLNAAFGSGIDWQTSAGEDKHRRGLYTTWRRSNPYPSMATFDAPNREVCTLRRSRSNTPLQALVTLNDPVYVEAAQALARRIVKEGGVETTARIDFAFRVCLARSPSPAEASRLSRLVEESLADFRSDQASAKKLTTEPLGPAPEGADIAEMAAWTVAANVMLNLDEMLMKR
jgi:mono/diheme cytochrome c family protein